MNIGNNPEPEQLSHWDLRGKLSVRTPNETVTGFISWNQSNDRYDIFITGPFGQGSTTLSGDAHRITLNLPGWKSPRTSTNPAALMQQYLGWQFPIEDVRYWVKAQPHPDYPSDIATDNYGLTESITQHGWDIDYSRYQQQGNYWLPGRLKITGHNHRFILVINDWVVHD